MEVGTTLSKTLHTARSHADYDAACKRLLSEKVILAWIMKNCLKEYRNCSIQEIMDNYIEGEPQIAKVPVTPAEPLAHIVLKYLSSTKYNILYVPQYVNTFFEFFYIFLKYAKLH